MKKNLDSAVFKKPLICVDSFRQLEKIISLSPVGRNLINLKYADGSQSTLKLAHVDENASLLEKLNLDQHFDSSKSLIFLGKNVYGKEIAFVFESRLTGSSKSKANYNGFIFSAPFSGTWLVCK